MNDMHCVFETGSGSICGLSAGRVYEGYSLCLNHFEDVRTGISVDNKHLEILTIRKKILINIGKQTFSDFPEVFIN